MTDRTIEARAIGAAKSYAVANGFAASDTAAVGLVLAGMPR